MHTELAKKTISPFEALKSVLNKDSLREQMALALPKGLRADTMVRMALTAAMGNREIAEAALNKVGQASIIKAMLTAAQFGLKVDGREGYLVPFKQKGMQTVTFIPGYQGLIQKAYNHPAVGSVWANVVREKDTFVYREGLTRTLDHEIYDGDEDPGKLRYAYAVCSMKNGATAFVVLNRRKIKQVRAFSRGSDSSYSPWTTNEEAMWMKSAVRQLAKFMPQSSELLESLDYDEEADTDKTRFAQAKVVTPADPNNALPEITEGEDEMPMDEQEGPPVEQQPEPEPAKPRRVANPVKKTEAPAAAAPAPAPAAVAAAPTMSLEDQLFRKLQVDGFTAREAEGGCRRLRFLTPEQKLGALSEENRAAILGDWDSFVEQMTTEQVNPEV